MWGWHVVSFSVAVLWSAVEYPVCNNSSWCLQLYCAVTTAVMAVAVAGCYNLSLALSRCVTAALLQLVNTAPEAELGRILRDYGEEKSWKAVARR